MKWKIPEAQRNPPDIVCPRIRSSTFHKISPDFFFQNCSRDFSQNSFQDFPRISSGIPLKILPVISNILSGIPTGNPIRPEICQSSSRSFSKNFFCGIISRGSPEISSRFVPRIFRQEYTRTFS